MMMMMMIVLLLTAKYDCIFAVGFLETTTFWKTKSKCHNNQTKKNWIHIWIVTNTCTFLATLDVFFPFNLESVVFLWSYSMPFIDIVGATFLIIGDELHNIIVKDLVHCTAK